MSSAPFRFQQFEVAHDRCAMKIGTDSVVLGAWAKMEAANSALDIGTGSGILALMLAQRYRTLNIEAVEIDEAAASQAAENFAASPFAGRLQAQHTAVQDFAPAKRYDGIICNPPYFIQSLAAPDSRRNIARHEERLRLGELARAVERLLAPQGSMSLMLPETEAALFVQEMACVSPRLRLVRQCLVYTRPSKGLFRVLMTFGESRSAMVEQERLILFEEEGYTMTAAYRDLTAAFYTSFHRKASLA